MIKLLILLASFALVYGNVVTKTSRQGCMNTYYFVSIDNPRNLIPIPTDIAAPESIESVEEEIPDSPEEEDGENGESEIGGESEIESEGDSLEEGAPSRKNLERNVDADHPLYVDNEKQTMVIVHGHGGDKESTLNPLVMFELFNGRHDHNVIIVDWSSFTKQSYGIAVAAVPNVGTCLGHFLTRLADQRRILANSTHLVGFNLGAHAVGFAGRTMSTRPGRITGLDPSKSQWGSNTPRLSRNDAAYVEVIHTDGNGVLANGIGTPIGNIDFFVNGGGNQPGCITHQCCHNRAYEVFAATLSRQTRLVGSYCSTNLQMSLNTCRGPTMHIGGTEFEKLAGDGSYRVNTGRSFPF